MLQKLTLFGVSPVRMNVPPDYQAMTGKQCFQKPCSTWKMITKDTGTIAYLHV